MLEKLKQLLNSVRFWMATLGTLFQILRVLLPQFTEIWNILTIYLGVVFAAGTVDSAFTKLGDAMKKPDITVTNPDKVIGVSGDMKGDIN